MDVAAQDKPLVSLFVEDDGDSDVSLTSTVEPAQDSDLEYEVVEVLAERSNTVEDVEGEYEVKQYLIKWEGYPMHECTWEPEENLSNGVREEWDAKKGMFAAGLAKPFDLQVYKDAVNEACKQKMQRHIKRNHKREQCGLPLTEPLFENMTASSKLFASHDTSDESNSEAMEENTTEDMVSKAKDTPSVYKRGKNINKRDLPPSLTKDGKGAKLVADKRALFQPSSSSRVKGPSHQDTAKRLDGAQGLGTTIANKTSQAVPNKQTAGASAVPRRPSTTTKPSSALAAKFSGKRTATKSRMSSKPAASKSTPKVVTNVFVEGKKRKPRTNLEVTMADSKKDSKPFKNFHTQNVAKKKAIEKADAAPADPSSIPTRFLLTPSTSRSAGQESPDNSQAAGFEGSLVDTTGIAPTAFSPKPVAGEPVNRPKKLVRFTEPEPSPDSVVDEPMNLDSPDQPSPTVFPTYQHTASELKQQPSVPEQNLIGAQDISATASFGPPRSRQLQLVFQGIRGHEHPGLTEFLAGNVLQFQYTCTPATVHQQGTIPSQLSGGLLKAVEDSSALVAIKENLRRSSFGLYLPGPGFSVLVFPADSVDWGFLIDSNAPVQQDCVLRYTIFPSNFDLKLYAPTSPPLDRRPSSLRKRTVEQLFDMDYNALLPTEALKKGDPVFFLMFPRSEQQLTKTICVWLRMLWPGCKILTNETEGSWNRFLDFTKIGSIFFHESITMAIRKLPRLWEALDDRHCFWNVSFSEYFPALYPSTNLDAGSRPAKLEMTRLFPHGRAILVTPSFAVSEPQKLCSFLAWFRTKVMGSDSHYILVVAANFSQYLHQLVLEKALSQKQDYQRVHEDRIEERCRACDLMLSITEHNQHAMLDDSDGDMETRKFTCAPDFIDANDEQSLVNWFAYWSTLRLDSYRKFYVLGSRASGQVKAFRTVRVPNYVDGTSENPDMDSKPLEPTAKQGDPDTLPDAALASALQGKGVCGSSTDIVWNDCTLDLKRWLWDSFDGLRTIWSKVYRQPVSWLNIAMADHFGDPRVGFATYSNWLSFVPLEFTKAVNTYIGVFYTTDMTYERQEPRRLKDVHRHPWLAILRPIDPHRDLHYSQMELLIWDCSVQKRVSDENPDMGCLLEMQRKLVEFISKEIPKRQSKYHLARVWLGGFDPPAVDPPNPVNITAHFLWRLVGDIKRYLPPFKYLLLARQWRLLEYSPGSISESRQMGPGCNRSSIGDRAPFPRIESDKHQPEKVIFHAPRGSNAGNSACYNDLYRAAFMARKSAPECEMFRYQFRCTLDWYHDLKVEDRHYSHINVDSWDRIFDQLRIPW